MVRSGRTSRSRLRSTQTCTGGATPASASPGSTSWPVPDLGRPNTSCVEKDSEAVREERPGDPVGEGHVGGQQSDAGGPDLFEGHEGGKDGLVGPHLFPGTRTGLAGHGGAPKAEPLSWPSPTEISLFTLHHLTSRQGPKAAAFDRCTVVCATLMPCDCWNSGYLLWLLLPPGSCHFGQKGRRGRSRY